MIKAIPNKFGYPLIKFDKIKPFVNKCKVTGDDENCNIKIEYIPNESLIEIGSYREMFVKPRHQYIEEICKDVFDTILIKVNPKYLKVTVYLEDAKLTPWNVTLTKGKI